jgi:hypothetical protein
MLLLNSLDMKGDATISRHYKCLPKDIAMMIWKQMLVMNKDSKGQMAFYYTATEGKDVSTQ